jgi:SAM-dependent methyltransferase
MDILAASSSLIAGDDGIFRSVRQASVSYAEDGHDRCFGVEDGSFWFRHRNDCIAAVVGAHPPPGGAVLDLGGGNGFVAQRLLAEGHDVVLLEPGAVGARNARVHRALPHVVCATLEDAAFRAGSFGAVGMFDVIEHVEDDRAFLEQVRALLAPGGRLYLTVPCHSWLWSRADIDAGHFRRHTLASLATMLGGTFRIDYASYFFAPLVLPQLLLRAIPHRLGLDRRSAVLTTEAEHGGGDGLVVRTIERLLEREATRIGQQQRIRFGASALLAATVS